eukprot:gene19125-25730_t
MPRFSVLSALKSTVAYHMDSIEFGALIMAIIQFISALKNTVVYHMGSIAFGTLIMAVIRFTRFMLEYLENKAKDPAH